MILFSYGLRLGIALLLISPLARTYPRRSGAAKSVVLKLAVDGEQPFYFDKLRVAVEFLPENSRQRVWTESLTPDRSGEVAISVPPGQVVTVSVSTYDPTILVFANKYLKSYRVKEGQPYCVGTLEVDVPAGSSFPIVKVIPLVRTAALQVWVPPSLERGFLVLRRPSWRHTAETLWFSTADSVSGQVLGGLKAGTWILSYLDDRNREVWRSGIQLKTGEVLGPRPAARAQ
ncbi:MAG: hypothetical protein ACREDR_24990 [Blastocatellia bacterium]